MKVFTFFAFVFVAVSAWGQPVRDLVDAQEVVRAHMRDMQPAVEQIRELGLVLNLYANVQRDLTNAQLATAAFDRALGDVNDYIADATKRGAPLDRETRAMLESTRRLLDAARSVPPTPDVNDVREKIHHNTIHPLQRRAMQMARQVESITRMYDNLATLLRTAEMISLGHLERLAMDPEKP